MPTRKRGLTTADIIAILQQEVAECGSQTEAAKRLRIKLSYFNDVLHGRRDPGPQVLKALGLQKRYEKVS